MRGSTSRITFERQNAAPVWTPDGKRLIYNSGVLGQPNGSLNSVAADGSGQPVTLIPDGSGSTPTSVAPDGKTVIGMRNGGGALVRGTEAWVLTLASADKTPDAKAQPFLDTRFTRGDFQFSPDGKWVAYDSNESGRDEVYVIPYPGPGGKAQVSTGGGLDPHWNRNGRELFFRSGDKMMIVDVETGASFRTGTPRMLFEKRVEATMWLRMASAI
jgi:Tol biopolymer transport system component